MSINAMSCKLVVITENSVPKLKQEAQGLGALLDKMEDNDHIKLGNIEV